MAAIVVMMQELKSSDVFMITGAVDAMSPAEESGLKAGLFILTSFPLCLILTNNIRSDLK